MAGSWTNQSISELTIPTSQTGGTGARIEINVGQSGEIQVFNAAGQLVDTIGGPFGEIISYSVGPTLDVGFLTGAVVFGHAASNFANAGAIFGDLTFGGGQQWDTGTGDVDHLDALRLTVRAGRAGQATGSPFAPQIAAIDTSLNSAVDVYLSGSVIHTATDGTPQTWQTPSYNAGWAGGPSGGTVQPFQFRVDDQNNLYITGAFHSTSGAPGLPFTLPAGYRPAIEQRPPAVQNDAGTLSTHILQILPNGDVGVFPNFTVANADLYISTIIPLGQIP